MNASLLPRWALTHSYLRLPDYSYARVNPRHAAAAQLIWLNHPLMVELGLSEGMDDPPLMAEVFSGNRLPESAMPLALAYAGHQFGNFTMLGDGRALLIGEATTKEGTLIDLQFKGSGRTPYSRRGDGRAVLGAMMRECLVSESLYALGIPTTRTLAVTATGDEVVRETLLPGAVLTRTARSHLRVGTFEFFAYFGDIQGLRTLVDYTIQRHFPTLIDHPQRIKMMLAQIAQRQARLIAQWMNLGFVHGVMNTDNMSIVGDTLDFGPCALLDEYDPNAVFSSIDHQGRYAFNRQSAIGAWNLARLFEALAPLIAEELSINLQTDPQAMMEHASWFLESYQQAFADYEQTAALEKIGLLKNSPENLAILQDWRKIMQSHRLDFTNAHRQLIDSIAGNPSSENQQNGIWLRALPDDPNGAVEYLDWRNRWRAILQSQNLPNERIEQTMRQANPIIIARNHRIESAIKSAYTDQDFTLFHRLMSALSHPFDDSWLLANRAFADHSKKEEDLRRPPDEHERVRETFCGT